jgi:hypothetical protein
VASIQPDLKDCTVRRSPACSAIVFGLTASLLLAGLPARAQVPDGLGDLVGVKGRDGEGELEKRGYVFHHTSKSETSAFSYWWHPGQSTCIRVLTTDGRYERITKTGNADCTQKDAPGMSTGAAVAVGAAALLGIAALAHKSHHREDRPYDERQTADFERGFRDGLYNNTYHNYGNRRDYSDGYSKGVEQRRQESNYRGGSNWRGGYAAHVNVSDMLYRDLDYARSNLQSRGFRQSGERRLGGGRMQWYYWNDATRQCLDIQTRDNAVVSLNEAGDHACR